jgi:iron complex outermembrane receptor protein
LLAGNTSGTRIALTADSLELTADDPQGLTFAEAVATPHAASAGALAFDTRKHVRQQQLGAHAEQALGARNTLWFNTWVGSRKTFQMLSIPVAAQQAPAAAAGSSTWIAITPAPTCAGAGMRAWRNGRRASRGHREPAIVRAPARLRELHRRHPRRGGALRRDQQDTVRNRDLYAEARWDVLRAGRRPSGSRAAASTSLRAIPTSHRQSPTTVVRWSTHRRRRLRPGWRANDALEFYANAGRGFETPSFAELAYRTDAAADSTMACVLRSAARASWAARASRWARVRGGLFDSRTQDELVVASNLGGRSTYTNAHARVAAAGNSPPPARSRSVAIRCAYGPWTRAIATTS